MARSGDQSRNIPPQLYPNHIIGMVSKSVAAGKDMFFPGNKHLEAKMLPVIESAGYPHDIGKLSRQNQLAFQQGNYTALPLYHSDAGCLYCLRNNAIMPAMLVAYHHTGLPDSKRESRASEGMFRGLPLRKGEAVDVQKELIHKNTVVDTNSNIDAYILEHFREIPNCPQFPTFSSPFTPLQIRLMMSCFTEGDYQDASEHKYGKIRVPKILLLPKERLRKLKEYVVSKKMNSKASRERIEMRCDFFEECLNYWFQKLLACSGSTGLGKTLSIMAYQLCVAERLGLRHIIIVAPYTAIIDQIVSVLREAVCLPGEDPELVVAAHHHGVDLSDFSVRHAATLWTAPIIVTTSVQFFETLTSNWPAKLRKLHELPRSSIYIDEVQNALPIEMWPLAWKLMKELSDDWQCQFIFGSGSLVKMWEFKEIGGTVLPDIVSPSLRARCVKHEKRRIKFVGHSGPAWTIRHLVNQVKSKSGARLVVLNTILSAAKVADALMKEGVVVEHLSTALSMNDRRKTIENINKRLENKEEFAVVGTSCIETGLDFSFACAFRESCSVMSALQTGGRVARHDEFGFLCEVIIFKLYREVGEGDNPSFRVSKEVLDKMMKAGTWFNTNKSADEIATEAIRLEIEKKAGALKMDKFSILENNGDFRELAFQYRVIEDDSIVAVVDKNVVNKVLNGTVTKEELQNSSVCISDKKVKTNFPIRPITPSGEIYEWTGQYDGKIGYMREFVK